MGREGRTRDDDLDADIERDITRHIEETSAQLWRDLHQRRPYSDHSDEREHDHSATQPYPTSFLQRSLGSVFDFASNLSQLHARFAQEVATQKQEVQESWRLWSGSEVSERAVIEAAARVPDSQVSKSVRAVLEAGKRHSLRDARRLFKDDALFWDDTGYEAGPLLSFGGACYYRSEAGDNLPSTAALRSPLMAHRWLGVDWFKRDQYSPLRLEVNTLTSQAGIDWRSAFEDLMSTSLGSTHGTGYERYPLAAQQDQSGSSWWRSLMLRGIVPPIVPALYNDRHIRSEEDYSRTLSELVQSDATATSRSTHRDLQRLIQEFKIMHVLENGSELAETQPQPASRITPRDEEEFFDEIRRAWEQPRQSKEQLQAPSDAPGPMAKELIEASIAPTPSEDARASPILSQMTRTETVRLPDGSVTTKVVMIKRFADGREETNESEHVTHAAEDGGKRESGGKEGPRGWFWS